MKSVCAIFKREFFAYFATPIAYVFIVIFLFASGVSTFFFLGFYESGQADLSAFFYMHPWLYLFLVPALSMRLWAEERRSGTIELLFTLPVTPLEAVVDAGDAAQRARPDDPRARPDRVDRDRGLPLLLRLNDRDREFAAREEAGLLAVHRDQVRLGQIAQRAARIKRADEALRSRMAAKTSSG